MVPTGLVALALVVQLTGVFGQTGGAVDTGTGGTGGGTPPPTVPVDPTTPPVTDTTPAPPPTPPPTAPAPPPPSPPDTTPGPSFVAVPTPDPTPTARPSGTTPPASRRAIVPASPSTPADSAEPPPEAETDDSPPTETGPTSAFLHRDKPSSEPGGVVTLTGVGCEAGVPVAVSVNDVAVGSIPGRDDGRFVALLTLPELEPGRYDINIDCGTTFTVPIDIVVATSVHSPNSVLALFIFFVLLVLVLFRRRRVARRARRATPSPGAEVEAMSPLI